MAESIPPDDAGEYGLVLRLLGTIERLAYDQTMHPADQVRRIRDALGAHRGVFTDPDDEPAAP